LKPLAIFRALSSAFLASAVVIATIEALDEPRHGGLSTVLQASASVGKAQIVEGLDGSRGVMPAPSREKTRLGYPRP
jgi:hypothetical protein